MPTNVPGFGPPDAKIVFIGEAPGETEEIEGRPFVGSSGHLLNQVLSQIGINRHECYLTNVVKVRPPNNDFGVFYADPKRTTPSSMLNQSITELHAELRRLRPNAIVPLGGEALRALTNKRGIEKWRGSILPNPLGPGKVIPTYHPSYILRSYAELPIFEHDLRRAFEESTFPELHAPNHRLEISPSFSRVMEFLSSLLDSPRKIAFDIETTQNHVRCLGIADSSSHAICIPFTAYHVEPPSINKIFIGRTTSTEVNSYWSEDEEYAILALLSKVFSSLEIPKIAQNYPFDSQILGREFGFAIHGLDLDTMIAAHTMYPELPKGLDFLASLYTKVPYYSDYDVSVDIETWRYNCLDCVVTYEVAESLEESLSNRIPFSTSPKWSSLTFQKNHIQPAMLAMTRVGQRGVLIDTSVRDKIKSKLSEEMSFYEEKIRSLSHSDLNPASSKQLQDHLYDRLKLPLQRNRKTKQPTADENALLSLSVRFPEHSEFFNSLLEWRERSKMISTYLEVPLTPDNRITTSYNVVGTVNGRCNSSKTIWGLGTNLQNIPKRSIIGRELRKMFIADPGFTLIKADLSQAQWRAVCWLGRMTRLIEQYLNNPKFDVHRWVASLIYRVDESAVTDDQRNIAKNGVYGGAFHMMPKTAAVTYKIPLTEATFVLNAFWKALPEVPLWWKDVEQQINSTRTLVSPFGRVRSFMGRIDDSLYRDAYAFGPQAIEADIIHRAVVLCESLLTDATPVLQIHDELVILCRTEALSSTLPMVKKLMECPVYVEGIKEPLIIPSDVSYGPNWLDQKKFKEL